MIIPQPPPRRPLTFLFLAVTYGFFIALSILLLIKGN